MGRIVVTDLTNRIMPMIRYDTGDIGAIPQNRMNKEMSTLQESRGVAWIPFTPRTVR